MDLSAVAAGIQIVDRLERATAHYVNTSAIARSSVVLPSGSSMNRILIQYSLTDVLLIAALTDPAVLLTGRTDCGKTTLGKAVMRGLFGAEDGGWHRIDVDLDFGRDQYVDVDFGIIADGRKISDGLFRLLDCYRLPGLIVDELNRSHAKLINRIIHFFDRDVYVGGGQRDQLGFPVRERLPELWNADPEGIPERYQFQIAAINEGDSYHGTFDLDQALRRRLTIEIPLDVFPPTPQDRFRLISGIPDPVAGEEVGVQAVLEGRRQVRSIPRAPRADHFLLYLQAMDTCVNSRTGSKLSVPSVSGSLSHLCQRSLVAGQAGSCRYLAAFPNEMCPAVRAISEGVAQSLTRVARGFAWLRAIKVAEHLLRTASDANRAKARDLAQVYGRDLRVEVDDIVAAYPLVAGRKAHVAPDWVAQWYDGNPFLAVQGVANEARRKFDTFYEQCAAYLVDLSSPATRERGRREIERYCETFDHFMWPSMAPLLETSEPSTASREEALAYLS